MYHFYDDTALILKFYNMIIFIIRTFLNLLKKFLVFGINLLLISYSLLYSIYFYTFTRKLFLCAHKV